jgi:hypothetical protein
MLKISKALVCLNLNRLRKYKKFFLIYGIGFPSLQLTQKQWFSKEFPTLGL